MRIVSLFVCILYTYVFDDFETHGRSLLLLGWSVLRFVVMIRTKGSQSVRDMRIMNLLLNTFSSMI